RVTAQACWLITRQHWEPSIPIGSLATNRLGRVAAEIGRLVTAFEDAVSRPLRSPTVNAASIAHPEPPGQPRQSSEDVLNWLSSPLAAEKIFFGSPKSCADVWDLIPIQVKRHHCGAQETAPVASDRVINGWRA